MKRTKQFHFPREVLLVDIERYCSFADCAFRNVLSLTKLEAIEYRGFRCGHCDRWNPDAAAPEEFPSSWRMELIQPSEPSM